MEVLGEGEGKDGAEGGKKAKRARASDANSHEPASDAPKNKPAAGASGEAVGGKRKRLSEGEGGGLHEKCVGKPWVGAIHSEMQIHCSRFILTSSFAFQNSFPSFKIPI